MTEPIDPAMVIVAEADLSEPADGAAIVACIAAYAADPMGGGYELSHEVREAMVPGLRATPAARVWLARAGARPLGVCVVLQGYSTFAARPRWNVHDLAVVAEARGLGIGRRLLTAVVDAATDAGCSAVSLEVRRDNAPARGLYTSLGFGEGDDAMDFWVRPIG
ncbi:MAG: GNAT family N-acetyltransferase [Patulibacter minatonensis]